MSDTHLLMVFIAACFAISFSPASNRNKKWNFLAMAAAPVVLSLFA